MGKVYAIGKKRYTFEEVSYTPGKEQVFKVNGVEVKLSVERGFGNECFMDLQMPRTSREKANDLLPAIYAIMDKRIKDGSARKLEQAAMLQLHYNEALRAEYMARGGSGEIMSVRSVVNKDDLSVKNDSVKLKVNELLDKKFPWRNDDNSKEKKNLKLIETYRKLEYYPNGSLHDELAQQRRNFDETMHKWENPERKETVTANFFARMLLNEGHV